MKKILKRVLIGLAAFLVLGTAGLAIAVKVREHRTFDAPYPDLRASADPAIIARGRYLALGPAHCRDCHTEPGAPASDEPRLSGGVAFHTPVGTFYTPNITPDPTTGIGRYTDAELARALRYGVHPTGRAMVPFMPFANMADDDLTAVISYLRSRPPEHHAVPRHDINLLGRFVKAFILEPTGPTGEVAKTVERGPTAAYGRYLANFVSNCTGCHTEHDMKTGEAIGEPFAGGMELESHSHPGTRFVTPNLTPDPTSGHITAWTEDQFVARFRHAVETPSPMPWRSFSTMTDDDLRALYRYLRSLPPVNTSNGPRET
jgi:mono/diheme cytochrome c family protein